MAKKRANGEGNLRKREDRNGWKPDTMMQKAIAIQSMERHRLKSVSGLQKL